MWSAGYLAHLRAAWARPGRPAVGAPRAGAAVGAVPLPAAAAGAGPAVATLGTVAAVIVTVVRSIVIAYIAVQVTIWHAFYLGAPWRLAGPAAAAACAAAVVAGLHRGVPARRLALADASVHLTLAVTAFAVVPPMMRGDSASWLYIALLDQLVLPALFTSVRLTGMLALASAAAFWGGDMIGRPAGGNSAVAAGGFMLALAAAMCWGIRALHRRAAEADAALAQADRETREQYVLRSRGAERREHERLLHDTVLNTLTALARDGTSSAAEVIGRCRHDIALMEQVLSEADGSGGLLDGLAAVAGEMRGRGLDVRLTASGAPDREVPAPVAAAIAHAVREALANVAQHAGTSHAWVEVSVDGSVQVLVRDSGAGFDAGQVDSSRLGVRRSIIERLADAGGDASVRSAPGAGTVVCLRWPRADGERPADGEWPAGRGQRGSGHAGG